MFVTPLAACAWIADLGDRTLGEPGSVGPKDAQIEENVAPPIDAALEVDADVSQPDAAPPSDDIIYAHTPLRLYAFRPSTRELSEVGAFSCMSPSDTVIDLAVNGEGRMYATSYTALLHVDPRTGACTAIPSPAGGFPNSLSFVPAGTVFPDAEALVGYQGIDGEESYVRIDLMTGAKTTIGTLNDPASATKYRSSGDLVAVKGSLERAILTVRAVAADAASTDLLAEVNPTNGRILKIAGDTRQVNVWGLAFWAGKAYGFSNDGRVTQMNLPDVLAHDVDVVNKTFTTSFVWYGAAVTTNAPLTP